MLTLAIIALAVGGCSLLEAGSGSCAGATDDDVWISYGETYYEDIGWADDVTPGPGGQPRCDAVRMGDCLFYITSPGDPASPRPITLADIAHFRPTPPVDVMEPNGWMIVGLDANFYSTSTTQVVDGTLLGNPASVRFTPTSWRWTYGDGSSASLSTGGMSWRGQGIQEFDPTPTSHVYRSPGTYTIGLSVGFSAEYRVGGSAWTRIPGILSVPAPPLEATAGDAKTVLVARDCLANPTGPGC